ncbi:MAG: hypothetical protein OXQ94_17265 [Gemmatimonadota bacterium]|nr:hypothetical protein [Gemmatimonadota bacterium]MDE2873429.1 hypothetical protein [Gemmatimonadota bacterium]
MSLIVPRTVTVVGDSRGRSAPLANFRSARAYVLLGDPGAGKTEAFREERKELDDGEFITARRFLRRGVDRLSEWEGRTLFIDGLDEVRAGSSDPRRQLDEILERLERLDKPHFRLSCRAADWLGRNDLTEIVAEAGYEDLQVLCLEPLTLEDVRAILVDLAVPDAAGFLAKARDIGLEGLLDNPQSLRMLVKATRDGEWPEDRKGTLTRACRRLARERNDQHRAAHGGVEHMSVERILAAAQRLAALILLSDRDHVSLDPPDDSGCFGPDDIGGADLPALARAVKSNLFEGRGDGRFAPVHHQVSEFLAARFLHDRIDSGLPARRVLALMTGHDGVVVTKLRGLAAWLAAFDPASRWAIVETDPVGVALHGDVGGFRGDEMERLLRAFAKRAGDIRPWNWPAPALASLLNDHSVALLAQYLEDDDRSEGRQTVVGLLLHALSRADRTGPCTRSLHRAIRDATWDPWVRKSALRVLLRPGTNEAPSALIKLLDDLRDGPTEDRDGDLSGTLLKHLYRVHLGPEQVWDYLVPSRSPDYVGTYRVFWSAHLPNRTRGKDLVALLGSLMKRGTAFRRQNGDDWVRRMIQELVRRALEASGDRATASTLYDWLELIDFEEVESSLARTRDFLGVCRWLADRPELQKELVLEGLHRRVGTGDSAPCADTRGAGDREGGGHGRADDAVYYALQIRGAVFRAGIPADLAAWSLQQAVAKAATNSIVARILLDWSGPWTQDAPESGLSIDEVRVATQDVPVLRDEVTLLWEAQRKSETRDAQMRLREEENEHRQERKRKRREFITYVRKHTMELQSSGCPPVLLHHIGLAYHDIFLDQKAATPRLRVLKLLQGHRDLADAAIEGFRRVLDRNDLPTLREAIRLNEQKQMSRYALPILAGLDAMSPNALKSRRPEEIARAAAFYYLTPLNVPGHPKWYRWALDNHPEPIAEALLKVTRSRVRRRLDCLYLWDFARNESYRRVARLVAVPMLRAFPTRCTEPQVSALGAVLLAAVRWQADGMAAFVDERASKPDLDVSQRSLWLATGLLLSPGLYAPRITEFLEDGEEARSREIVRLLASTGMKLLPMPWGNRELATMIKLLGSRYSPWRPEGFGMAEIIDEDRTRVDGLISSWAATLASRTDREASEALQSLATDSALEPWHQMLGAKRDEQVVARRDATLAVPDLDSVRKTLSNKQPANPADLVALVADRLERLDREIRYGTTDDWRQYWREDERRRLLGPRREESCRDALLSDLRKLLPGGVDAQREADYTRGNRSDIRVFFDGHAIPVEIKKDYNSKLWRAVANQLVPKYATAPESSGFGIFLVLWFGEDKTPVPPSGRRPKTPEELRARLEEHLRGPYRHKIRVIVIDVSSTDA